MAIGTSKRIYIGYNPYTYPGIRDRYDATTSTSKAFIKVASQDLATLIATIDVNNIPITSQGAAFTTGATGVKEIYYDRFNNRYIALLIGASYALTIDPTTNTVVGYLDLRKNVSNSISVINRAFSVITDKDFVYISTDAQSFTTTAQYAMSLMKFDKFGSVVATSALSFGNQNRLAYELFEIPGQQVIGAVVPNGLKFLNKDFTPATVFTGSLSEYKTTAPDQSWDVVIEGQATRGKIIVNPYDKSFYYLPSYKNTDVLPNTPENSRVTKFDTSTSTISITSNNAFKTYSNNSDYEGTFIVYKDYPTFTSTYILRISEDFSGVSKSTLFKYNKSSGVITLLQNNLDYAAVSPIFLPDTSKLLYVSTGLGDFVNNLITTTDSLGTQGAISTLDAGNIECWSYFDETTTPNQFGCKNNTASNYNAAATYEDGSCVFTAAVTKLSFSAPTTSVVEGDGSTNSEFTMTITRDTISSNNSSVNLAIDISTTNNTNPVASSRFSYVKIDGITVATNPTFAGSPLTYKQNILFKPTDGLTKTISIGVLGESSPGVSKTFKTQLVDFSNAQANSTSDTALKNFTMINSSTANPNVLLSLNNPQAYYEGSTGGTTNFPIEIRLDAASSKQCSVQVEMNITPGLAGAQPMATSSDFVGIVFTANKAYFTITFAPGQTSQILNIPTSADTVSETNKSYKITLQSPTNCTINGSYASSFFTILNDDNSILIDTVTSNGVFTETNVDQTVVVTVKRLGDLTQTVLFDFLIDTTTLPSGEPPVIQADFNGATINSIFYNDFRPNAPITIQFPSNSPTVDINIVIKGDTNPEAKKYGYFVIRNASSNSSISLNTEDEYHRHFSLEDNDNTSDIPVLTNIQFAVTTEGNSGTVTQHYFTANRTGNLAQASTLQFNFRKESLITGAAIADEADFGGVLPSGTIYFAPNQNAINIGYNINEDTTYEADEYFVVELVSVAGGNIIINQTKWSGSITNDDANINVPTVLVTTQIQPENTGNIPNYHYFIVQRKGAGLTNSSSFDWKLIPGDSPSVTAVNYNGTFPSGTHVFAPDVYDTNGNLDTSKDTAIINWTVAFNPAKDVDRNYKIEISNLNNLSVDPTSILNGKVVDSFEDRTTSVTIQPLSDTEGTGIDKLFNFNAIRSGFLNTNTTFKWRIIPTAGNTVNANDFTGGVFPEGSVTFNATTSTIPETKVITFKVSADSTFEQDKKYVVEIYQLVNAITAKYQYEGTIFNDDLPTDAVTKFYALQPKLDVKLLSGCKKLKISDITGAFSSTNRGGYGILNGVDTTDFSEAYIELTPISQAGEDVATIRLSTIAPIPSKNPDNFLVILNTGALGAIFSAIEFRIDYVIKDNSTPTKVYVFTKNIINDCSIKCCLEKLKVKIRGNTSCDNDSFKKLIRLQAIYDSALNAYNDLGSPNKGKELFKLLQKECETCGCDC